MAFDVAPGAPIAGRSFFRDRDRAEVRGEARLTRNRMKSLNHRDTLKKCSEILSRPLSEFLKKVTSSDHKPGQLASNPVRHARIKVDEGADRAETVN
jgi:hypothetical protein